MATPVRILALVLVAATMAGCGISAVGGGKTLVIATDLPLQGASKDASNATNNALALYLSQIGNKVGDYTIQLKKYNDSTSATGRWDSKLCAQNASAHVQAKDEVAVIGTYDPGCTQIEIPVLGGGPSGPMLMVSHANTDPGLTRAWAPGTPDKYYPSGKRNFARVTTTDDAQGKAAAAFAAETLGVEKCYVLNDGDAYGRGVATAFAAAAAENGIRVIGAGAWDGKAPNYTTLFRKIAAARPDCVYLGGRYDDNGSQLIKDKVSVLGDNSQVKLLGPDGFTGHPELDKLPQADGLYLTFAGLATGQIRVRSAVAATLCESYRTTYGSDQLSNHALYGVAAVQVILAAIEESDGTRKGVRDAVFSGDGITVPADQSVLGRAIHIDPTMGDTDARDISIDVVKSGTETFLQSVSVS